MKQNFLKFLLILTIPGILKPNIVPNVISIEKIPISIHNRWSSWNLKENIINESNIFQLVRLTIVFGK